MELDAVDVVLPVLQGHNLPLVALCGNFQTLRKAFPAHYPAVVPAHDQPFGKALENVVLAHLRAFGGHAVEYLAQVLQLPSKDFPYGLMPQAYAQHGFPAGISTDDIQQQAGLRGNARARGQDYLVAGFQVRKLETVVSEHRHLRSQRLHQMGQVVGEAVVIVNDNYFHTLTFLLP